MGRRRRWRAGRAVAWPLRVVALAGMLGTGAACPGAHGHALGEGPLTGLPHLRIEAGMHTARINDADVDAGGRFLVTGSLDKTARIWSVADGALLGTLRMPIEGVKGGMVHAVAMSPDGRRVAAAGYTGAPAIFDRESGRLVRRLGELPESVTSLRYAPSGEVLVAGLGTSGIRVFDASDLRLRKADEDYAGDVYGLAFDARGRLATASLDRTIRLYDRGFVRKKQRRLDFRPFRLAFSPDGGQLAVGSYDGPVVVVLDATDLEPLRRYDLSAEGVMSLGRVAWTHRRGVGRLHAGGRFNVAGWTPIVTWPGAGGGAPEHWRVNRNTTSALVPLSGGGLAVAAQDPLVAVLDAAGKPRWKRGAPKIDVRGQDDTLATSGDGRTVRLGLDYGGARPHVFELGALSLTPGKGPDALKTARTQAPRLAITGWEDTKHPKLGGASIALKPYEVSRSLAIARDAGSFVLGTEWYLRHYHADGRLRWRKDLPSVGWAVVFAGDGRAIVAALDDGTLRWYRASDGALLLSLFVHADGKRWVAWTPQGFFAASPGGESLVGYQMNRGRDGTPAFFRVEQIARRFHRPDLVSGALTGDRRAVADATNAIEEVKQVLRSGVPPTIELVGAVERLRPPAGPDFRVRFRVVDQGSGVGRVLIRINGIVVHEAAARPAGPRRPKGQKTRTVVLSGWHGDNLVEISGFNGKGTVESVAARLKVKVNDPMARPATLHVFAVGISEYRDRALRLKHARTDAESLAALLAARGQGLFREVRVKTLVDSQAKRASILKAFEQAAAATRAQDAFVLYLAGHGRTLDGRYHFVPWDLIYRNEEAFAAASLSEEDIESMLAKLKARKVLTILDTCAAGAAAGPVAQRVARRGIGDKAAIARLMRATGRSFLAATSEVQDALEGIDGHGAFTYVLLEGLRGAANRDGNLVIDADELGDYVEKRVPELTEERFGYEQFPQRTFSGRTFPVSRAMKK